MTKSLTFVELDPPRCANVYGTLPCNARLIEDSDPVAASFDGTAYMTRGAGLTGAADSKLITVSCWFRYVTSATTQRLFSSATAAGGATLRARMRIDSSGIFAVVVNNAAGTQIGQIETTALTPGRLYHVIASFDLSDTGKRHLYVNDVSNLTATTYTNDTIDFTLGDWSIGANPDGSESFEGEIAELWVAPGVYIDFSVQANRRLFIDANGQPVSLGATGNTPTGSAPLIFQSGDISAWHTNKGTGGGFTLSGTLAEGLFGTGLNKCFNTRATCQDIDNYDADDPVTLRFAKPALYLKDTGIFAVPSIADVNITPCVVSLGKDLGQRASVEIVFKDHPDDDTAPGLDPYFDERDYDPYSQGTFWGKFRARHPYIIGAPLRVITGYVGQDLADMETRYFIVESYEGPSPSGRFTLRATDMLKLADAEKALAPRPSEGYLVSNITSSDGTMTLTPTGVGADYPHSGHINVGGSELVYFEHDPTAGNDANCLLLLQCDGADGSTTFTDTSSFARAMTANGTVQLDTGQYKFGVSSGAFDGVGDFVSAADSADWTFAGDFTLECWARFFSPLAARTLICHSTDINNMYRLFVTAAGALKFEVVSASVTTITLTSATGLIVTDTWYHLAVVRSGNSFLLFIDGEVVGTTTDSDAIPNFTAGMKIGISGNGSSDAMLGWIDVVRISNVARWTDDFDLEFETGYYLASTDVFAIYRGRLNTTAAAHTAQDRAQLVLAYVSADPADILYDLNVNYVPGFDADWIDLPTWQDETANYNGNLYTTYITEPTPVKTLQEEVVKQAALATWWDDVNEQLRLQVLRAVSTTAFEFNPDNYNRGTASLREQLDKRISQVLIYFGQINPLLPLANKENYRCFTVVKDEDSETNWGTPAIETILSRWIPQAGRTVADRLGAIIIGRYKTPPRALSFEVQRYSGIDPELGAGYQFACDFVQDETGAVEDVSIGFQVTQIKPREDAFVVSGEEMLFDAPATDLADRFVTFTANVNNLNLRTEHDSIYPAPDGSETVTFTFNSGLTIGSVSTALPTIDVGTWPSGTTINLIIGSATKVYGRGGTGGVGGLPLSAGNNGSAGGVALYTRKALSLTNNGEIKGGGGGGGGGGGHFADGGSGGGGGGGVLGGGGAADGLGGSLYGANGSTTAGGAGGAAGGAGGGAGGTGGAPGAAGSAGSSSGLAAGGSGAASGAGVDGHSYVTYDVTGTIAGGQIN